MWLLTFASQRIGNFTTEYKVRHYLEEKYGIENVKSLGEFQPMMTTGNGKNRPYQQTAQSGRNRCVAFECKEQSPEGWSSTTRYEAEDIPVLG
jgi:hypothetical protein